MATSPAIHRRTRDRRLYIGSAILIPLIVLIGFAPTYYLKPWFQRPALPSLLVHLHGAVAGAQYEIVFVSFDASTEVSLGTLTTNPAGNGHAFLRDAFPAGAVGTGNVVIKREGVDQYVTGFIVVR